MFTSRIERVDFPFAEANHGPIVQPDVEEVLGRNVEELTQRAREKTLIVIEGIDPTQASRWETVTPNTGPDNPRNTFHVDYKDDCDALVCFSMGPRSAIEFVSAQDQAVAMKKHRRLLNIQAAEPNGGSYFRWLAEAHKTLGHELPDMDLFGPRKIYKSIYKDETLESQAQSLAGRPGFVRRLIGRFRHDDAKRQAQAARNTVKEALTSFFGAVDSDSKIHRHTWASSPSAVISNNKLAWDDHEGLWTGLLHRATYDRSFPNPHPLHRAHVREGRLCTEVERFRAI